MAMRNNGVHFGVIRRAYIGGVQQSALVLDCACERQEAIPCPANAPPELARKCAEKAGWFITKNQRKATCPTCHDARIIKAKATKESSDVSQPAPRGPLDKAIEFRVLRDIEDNWDEKAGCYLGEVNDETIAVKFKIGRAQVQQAREAVFGKIRRDSEIEALSAQVARALDIISGVDQRISDLKRQRGL